MPPVAPDDLVEGGVYRFTYKSDGKEYKFSGVYVKSEIEHGFIWFYFFDPTTDNSVPFAYGDLKELERVDNANSS